MTGPAVGVVGGSARAAVGSALRAGLSPWAVDQYGDRDLRRVPFAVCPPEHYPAALPTLAAAFPPGPVLYTGGLEAHPAVVGKLAAARPLWGNPPAVLARVRDPFWLHDTLTACGLSSPRVLRADVPLATPGRWLCKNPQLSGGIGVRVAGDREPRAGDYVQEFIDGTPMSALFAGTAGGSALCGVTEQLIGVSWLHAGGFVYSGNVAASPSAETVAALANLAEALRPAGLRGLWGLDFILRDGEPFPVEVNPRYTAAVEVLELASGVPLLARHAAAFGGTTKATEAGSECGPTVGKAVYFAPRPLTFPAAGPWDDDLDRPFDPWRTPGFADIPHPGERVEAGRPVLTMFATTTTLDECKMRLRERAAAMDEIVFGLV